MNKKSCCWFEEEYARLQKIGKTPSELDLMIASIVKANDLAVVTRNKKDFELMLKQKSGEF
ncbi:MAG: hypothetical protein AABW75_00290 [Nanoarchaeota archaeon]